MVTEKIWLPFDTPHCAMATEFFRLLGKGECHMFLESPCQGVRVFQKHMTRPPFMATNFFWSPQKGATKVFFYYHRVNDQKFSIATRLTTEIHFQSPFVTGVV